MMNRSLKGHIRQLMLAGALGGLSAYASANDFSITDGQLTISNDQGYSSTVTINSDGEVTTPSPIPTQGNFGIPSFTFSLINEATTVTGGDHSFRVGVVISDKSPDNSRRLESFLGELVLNVADSTVTGSIPSQDLVVLGRDGTATLTVELTNSATNGPISVSGGSVTFDGDELVNRIVNSDNDFFTPVLDAFNEGDGEFKYSIVVEESSGATTSFGIVDGNFSAFPTSNTKDIFELIGNRPSGTGDYKIEDKFNEAFVVQGEFSVQAPATAPGDDDDDDTDPGGDPGDDPGDDTDGPGDDDTADRVNEALKNASTTAKNVVAAVMSGQSGLDVALTATESVNRVINSSGAAKARGSQIDARAANNAVRDVGNIISAIAGRKDELTPGQRGQLTTLTKSTVDAASRLVDDNSNGGDASDLADAVSEVVENATRAGVELDDELFGQMKDVSNRSSKATVRDLLPGVDTGDEDQVREVLGRSASHQETVIDSGVRIPNTSPTPPQNQGIRFRLVWPIEFKPLPSMRSPRHIMEASLLLGSLDDSNDIQSAQGNIQAVGDGELGIVENEDRTVTITLANEKYVGAVTGMRTVASFVPEGLIFRRNGGALMVADGLALDVSPVAADLIGFLTAVDEMGFDSTIRNNGAVSIDLGDGERFSGVFDYTNLTGMDVSSCGAVSISEPQSTPWRLNHAFSVNCENGISQNVVPFADNPAFYQALTRLDFEVNTNRDTGLVSISGEGNFRPSYYIRPLTSADQALLDAEGADDGIAFRALDINNNGRIDYQVISETGVQVFYSVP